MDKPKVSILVPCYNSEKFIAETIKCCLSQQYPNIEIIIVDDGSNDSSAGIAAEISDKFDNVHLYLQSNSGVCRARNLAFEKSTGDYIIFLDADDLIAPDTISSQVELLKDMDGTAVATCAWGRFYNSLDDFKLENQIVYKDYDSSIDLIEDLLNDGMFGLTCYLTPRTVIEKAGMWNEDLTINTDGEFFIRVLANAGQVKFSKSGCLYYRSNNPNSISRCKPTESKGKSLLLSYRLILEYLKGRNYLTYRAKVGLKHSFKATAYQYAMYEDIVTSAKEQVDALGKINDNLRIGGNYFWIMSRLIGFWNALSVKQHLIRK